MPKGLGDDSTDPLTHAVKSEFSAAAPPGSQHTTGRNGDATGLGALRMERCPQTPRVLATVKGIPISPLSTLKSRNPDTRFCRQNSTVDQVRLTEDAPKCLLGEKASKNETFGIPPPCRRRCRLLNCSFLHGETKFRVGSPTFKTERN